MSIDPKIFITAAISFVSTTLDDFAIIVMFFGKAQSLENVTKGYLQTCFGMTLGFTVVIAISLLGLVLGHFIESKYIALIGFIPLLMGAHALYELLDENGYLSSCKKNRDHKVAATDEQPQQDEADKSKEAEMGMVGSSNAGENKDGDENKDGKEEEEEEESNWLSRSLEWMLKGCLDPFTMKVLQTTACVSSDNIGIYIALFSSTSLTNVLIIVVIFYFMLGVNLALAVLMMKV
jgi:cadmium resistance protein CadD (predicted permease)